MKPSSLLLASALGLAAAVSTASAQAVVYRETFGNSGGSNTGLSTVGWAVNYGTGATSDSGNTTGLFGVSNGSGVPSNLANVGQSATTASQTNGFVFLAPQTLASPNAGAAVLAWTSTSTEYNGATPLTTSTVAQFSTYVGSGTTAQPIQFAVQVGGTWYVSVSTFKNTSYTSFTASAIQVTLNFNPAASNWRTLNFTQANTTPLASAGTGDLSVSSTAPALDLSGNITAFGIYVGAGSTGGTTNTGNTRFDTFTVTAIPEPSSFAALAGLGMLGFAATRRRRVRV